MTAASCFSRLRQALAPRPLPAYDLPADLDNLPVGIRIAEVLCWAVNRLERALSPSGRLRSWLLANALLALAVAIPALTVVPAITLVFERVAQWSDLLVRIAVNLLLAAAALLGLLLVLRLFAHQTRRGR